MGQPRLVSCFQSKSKWRVLEFAMSFTPYVRAAESAKQAVIEALRIDEDVNVLSELWRHYLGLRAIESNNLHTEIDDNVSLNVPADFQYSSYFGADPFTQELNIPGGAGQDMLTLS